MKLQIDILKPKGNKCWIFHKWTTEREEGCTKYQKCKKCKSKRIVQSNKYYKDVDFDYLAINDKYLKDGYAQISKGSIKI